MRRADRLFRIVEYLKARRQVVRGEDLARELEVSVRTVYRDIADLCASGVPVIGEAGVGYMLDRDYIVRPLMFDMDELESLILGAQMVESWGDADLGKATKRALDKIAAALPDSMRREFVETSLFSYAGAGKLPVAIDFSALRRSIRSKNFVIFDYTREDGKASHRRVRPLALVFFGSVWLLLGWCEMREDFRNFRLDRIRMLEILSEKFRDEKGKRVQDYKPDVF